MKNIIIFLSEHFHFFGGKIFSIYSNRHVFVMHTVSEGLSVRILRMNTVITAL